MSDHIDGELDAAGAARVERHLRWCPSCRRMLANLRRTVDGLRALGQIGEYGDAPDPRA